MAEGTVDNLNIQLSADADQAVKSLNNLASTLRSINTAFTKDISGMRKFSKELGTMTAALRGLNNIKVSAPDLSKLSKAMKSLSETKTSGAENTANDVKDIVNSLKGLGSINFNESGITKLTNSLRRLTRVDMSTFDVSKFQQITESVSTLGNMPDVSSGVNRFVSSLSRLANAGTKTGQSANDILRLGQQTALAARELGSVGAINDDVNLFVQSIGRLASAGGKTSQTASGLSALSKETLEFFKAMQNAPRVSENTIRMTQALAQLATAGGKVGTSTNTVTNAFEKLSRAGTSTMNALKKASSGIVSALQRLTGAGKGVNSLSLSLGNLLKTAIGFNIGYGLLNFGKSMFTLGSDVTEVENVVDVAFGGMAQSAYDFAKTAQEQFGLSELMALRYSGILMSMFNASGIAQRDAAEMSTTLTGLAGDLASFYNIDQEDAFTKLRSALAGEVEPMRALGVDMTVASMEAYALSQGITESWQSMSQAEKVMLRYNYLMSVTSAQQNDFQRTQASFANQTRLLTLNLQQLAATLGQGLIAAVLPAVTALNKLFAVLQKAAVAVRNFFYVLTGYEGGGSSGIVNDLASIGDASTGLEDLGSSGSDAADGLGDAAKAAEELKNATLGIDELNIISPNEPTSTGGTGGSGGGGGAGGVGGTDLGLDDGLLDLGGKEPEEYVSPWAEAIRKAFLAEDWEELGEVIADGLNRGLQKVYDAISWDNVGPKITAFTTAFTETFNSFANAFDFELLGRTIGTGINTIVNTLNQLIDGIDWINLGKRFADGFNGLVDEIDWLELGRLIGNKFMIAWDTLLGFVTTLDWGEVGRSLADGFNGMLQEISLGDIGTTIGTIVAGIIEMFREFFANVDWTEVIGQIKEGIKNALTAASDGGKNDGILAGILGIGVFAGLAKIIAPVITVVDKLSKALGGSGLTKSMGTALKGVGGKAGLSGAFTSLKTAIGAISAPVAIAVAAITGIAIGIKDLWDTSATFRDSVSEMWEKIANAFSEAKIRIWDETLVPLAKQLSELWDTIYSGYEGSGLKDIFEQIVTLLGDQLSSRIAEFIGIISNAFKTAGGIISGILTVLEGVITFVSGVFSGDWTKAWEGVKNIVKGVVDAISSFFSGLWETIKIIFNPVIEFFGNVFSSAYDKVTSIWQFIGSWFTEKVKNPILNIASGIGEGIENALKTAYNTVTSVWGNIKSFFRGLGNDVLDIIAKLVNGIGGGINWVADLLGAGKVFGTWEPQKFASGSKGIQKDTFGIVNDQKGATYKELILPPNGKPFIPKGRNVMLPLQKGTKIMPAGQTEEFLKTMKKNRFAGGIGNFFGNAWESIKKFTGNIMDYFDNPGKLVQIAFDKFIDTSRWGGAIANIGVGAINTIFDSAVEFIRKLFGNNSIEKAVQWAIGIANDNSHGYDQAHRTGPDYDCSSLVTIALQKAGLGIGIGTTSTMLGQLLGVGFKDVTARVNRSSGSGMKRGDVLLKPGNHTAMYIGDGKMVHATINEFGGITGGKTGDQTGDEIAVMPYKNHPWTYVLRFGGRFKDGIGTINLSDLFGAIPKLANGGLVMPGQLFVANERGPELIGRYGNKTAVIPNNQVVTSVSSGVEKAVERQNAEMTLLLRQILETNQRILAKDNSINLDGKRTNRLLDRAKSNAGYGFRRTVNAT